MSTHLTEEEQVEALKKWWKENGKSVIFGILLGFGAIFGWKGWQNYQITQSEQASAQYDRMLLLMQSGDEEAANKQAEKLMGEFKGSTYAYFAALELAKLKVEKDDLQASRLQLETAIANAPDSGLEQLARLRLVQVLISMKKLDEAEKLLLEASSGANVFAAEIAAYRGDIARARGDYKNAGAAYREALSLNAIDSDFIEMKLNELPEAGPAS